MTVRDRNNIPKLVEELERAKVRALREIGVQAEGAMKRTITESRPEWPPLKSATIARKGSSRPLIDEGIMRAKITSRVDEGNSTVDIGLFGDDDSRGRSGDETVEVGLVHEFGSDSIPARPFLRPTWDEKAEDIVLKTVSEKYNEAIERASQ